MEFPIDQLSDLANSPLTGLLAVIAILLIALVGLVLRALTRQSDSTTAALKEQVQRLTGQLEETIRRVDLMSERAFRAEVKAERLEAELIGAREDLQQAMKRNEQLEAELEAWTIRTRSAEERADRFEQLYTQTDVLYREQARQILTLQLELSKLHQRLTLLEEPLSQKGTDVAGPIAQDDEAA